MKLKSLDSHCHIQTVNRPVQMCNECRAFTLSFIRRQRSDQDSQDLSNAPGCPGNTNAVQNWTLAERHAHSRGYAANVLHANVYICVIASGVHLYAPLMASCCGIHTMQWCKRVLYIAFYLCVYAIQMGPNPFQNVFCSPGQDKKCCSTIMDI